MEGKIKRWYIFSADDPFLLGCYIIEESALPTKTDAETHFGEDAQFKWKFIKQNTWLDRWLG